MSRFARSTMPTRGFEVEDRFARTMPSHLQTFEQFQNSRIERLNLVEADLQAKREQELHELQLHLQDLTMQLSAAQNALADEERAYVNQRETLITEIQKVKTEADVKFAQAQVEFMERKTKMQREFDLQFQGLTATIPVPENVQEESESEELVERKRYLKKFEGSLRKFKQAYMNKGLDGDTLDEDNSHQLYTDRITRIEAQKRELLQSLKEDEHNNEEMLNELTSLLEEQELKFQNEIDEIQNRMRKKEESYRQTMDRIHRELEKIQEQRHNNIAPRTAKLNQLQEQTEALELEFRQKLKEASTVAEKLKMMLVNANLIKSQQLEKDRQMSQEHNGLMKTSHSLQQQLFAAERHLEKLREESTLLRKQLSARIGPRRTASLFML